MRCLVHRSPGTGDYGHPETTWYPIRAGEGWWHRPHGRLRVVVFCHPPPLGPYGTLGPRSHTWLIYRDRRRVEEGRSGAKLHEAMEESLRAAARLDRRYRPCMAWYRDLLVNEWRQ